MKPVSKQSLDLSAYLRPGDRVVVGQATSEPLALTDLLVQALPSLPGVNVFLGPLYSDTFENLPRGDFRLENYGAIGKAAHLARDGRLDIRPIHYSAIDRGYAEGRIGADCVLIQLAPKATGYGYNLGNANDYTLSAARRARVVLAEVNPDVPDCTGGDWPEDIQIHALVEAEAPPLELPAVEPGAVERTIGRHIAELVPDRAVLQVGVGAIPGAALAALRDHRGLGIHSGALVDGVVDLVEAGAITNAGKDVDTGIGAGGLLLGSRRLFDFMHRNPGFKLAPTVETHSLARMASLSSLHAINSAVEVDLTGQVNAETAGGRYVGAVGGQIDFVRGATASPGGRSIIALPSTARNGAVSRIVPKVETVTCARSDADTVVTEWGVAELKGLPLSARAQRMIAIADPAFREDLARYWHDTGRMTHE